MGLYNNIMRKCEDAFRSVILAQLGHELKHLGEDSVIAGGDSATSRVVPMIYVVCEMATFEQLTVDEISGNFDCTMKLGYVSGFKGETRNQRMDRAAKLFEICTQPDLPGLLNNQPITGFHVYGGQTGKGRGWMPGQVVTTPTDDNKIVQELTGVLYCRPTG